MLAACAWADSQADLAVIHQMRVHAANPKFVLVLHRSPVDSDLDAVILLGSPWEYMLHSNERRWEEKAQLGIFLQHRSNPGLIYKVVVAEGRPYGECDARVARVTPSEAVIHCLHEKGSKAENHKFRYDIRTKALLGQSIHDSFLMGNVLTDGRRTVLIGWNLEKPVAIEYLAGADPPFRVLSQREAASWIKRIPAAMVRSSFIGAATKPVFAPVRFGPDQQFSLRLRGVNDGLGLPGILAIHEQSGKSGRWSTLPQSSYDEFSAARPIRVQGGYVRGQTTIAEEIGPWQVVDGTLWFGKSFYDGEGTSGVGGFGYFDTRSRQFVIHSPAQIRDSSVSAILAETDGIWLGLAHRGKWGITGNGIMQLSHSGQALGRIELPEPVGGITRVNGGLLMATSFGAAFLDGQRVRRFFVDQSRRGSLRVVEADPGEQATHQ
ncbi:MAG: hypothetical protein IH602_08755 [Bryobacteraceae bacterium]|nr:hypothetical protein [Bryobacteraceae bacterium]